MEEEKRVLVGKAKGDPTYVVVIGQDVYEMSEDADMPNGVCLCASPSTADQISKL